MEWISVDRTQPEAIKETLIRSLKSCEMVLLYREQTGLGVLYMDEDRKGFYFFPDSTEPDDEFFKNVTHWMPIAEPPKTSDCPPKDNQ